VISNKHARFLDEYLIDLSPEQAYIRAGYSPNGARQAAYKLLQKPEIKKELEDRFAKSRLSSSDVIARLDKMAIGEIPTKIVKGSHSREEYDTHGAAVSLGKIYALFQDKIDLNISHLNITDE